MKCGNQGACEYYQKYLVENKEGFPIDKHDEIISVGNDIYECRAINGQSCSVVRTINLLEEINYRIKQ